MAVASRAVAERPQRVAQENRVPETAPARRANSTERITVALLVIVQATWTALLAYGLWAVAG